MTPLVLGALAIALAGPVPALLARSTRVHRTPVAALVLWQAIALAAVLAALGAGASLVTDQAWRRPASWAHLVVAAVALILTIVVLARLARSAHLVGTSLRALRRQHREHLDVLARPDDGIHVLDHHQPLAYCLPGRAESRVVVSAAALQQLSPEQLTAVLAHERAHLAARHDLVLEAFTVLHHAFPRWVSSDRALGEVRLLVEILADRAAVRAGHVEDLGQALLTMVQWRAPAGALGGTGANLVERVGVLGDRRPRPLQAAGLLAGSVAVLVLPTALVVAPWIGSL